MMSKQIPLYQWRAEACPDLDIDWPAVQRSVGQEQLEWLLTQTRDHCQLVLNKKDDVCMLTAEFYHKDTLTTYYLMWS